MVVSTRFNPVYYKCMEQKIEYTTREIDLLCRMIKSPSTIGIDQFRDLVIQLIEIQTTKDSMIETPIFFINLGKEFNTIEPYGEAKYFVIFNENSTNRFEFWTRHLRKFLFEATLKEMPLLINVPFVAELAKWRLIIAK